MHKEEDKKQAQFGATFDSLVSNTESPASKGGDKKKLYLIADKEITQELTEKFQTYFNHFKDHLSITFIDSGNLNLVRSVIQKSMQTPSILSFALGTQPYLEEYFFAEAEEKQIPFNMGNCSTSGRELMYDGDLKTVYKEHIYLTNLIQFGLHYHLSPPYFLSQLDDENFEFHRIGQLKADLTQVEPMMRDVNYLRFDLNSLKNSDFPAKKDFNPSGLESEEALQILRYAGLSPKMHLIHLTGFETEHIDPASTEFLAQAVWYTCHGLEGKVTDNPFDKTNVQEYVIEHDFYSFPLSFLRSKKSGRWWMKIPSSPDAPFSHVAIACDSYDYQKVIEGEIPYRLLKALERGKA